MRSSLLVLSFLFATLTFAQTKSFMPENDLDKQDGLFDNGMTEQMFNYIIEEVENYYKPIVSDLGGNLYIERNWKDNTVNAYASREGSNTYKVAMFGGLARRAEVTPDGFAMVVCHELGHHISGFPFVSDWAANEGQSDYFAMQACAKNLWQNQVEKNEDAAKKLDPIAKKLCDDYVGREDLNLCYREMAAGYSLANLLGSLNGQKINFATPDKTIVKKTYNQHPKAQCRLDTYVAGTLCSIKWNDALVPESEQESAKYLCTNGSSTDYDIQARPRCWFKPSI